MNKKQLASKVSKDMNITKAEAEKTIDSFLNHVSEALQKGEKIRLVGFGNFLVRTRAGRVGRNPRTGEKMDISSTKVPSFVPGVNLKALVRGK
jgi:DNA-binding protein HU-beta